MLHNRGYFLRDRDSAGALAAYAAAIDHTRSVVEQFPQDTAARQRLANHHSSLAAALLKHGDVTAAEKELTRTRELLGPLARERDADSGLRELDADVWRKLAGVAYATGRLGEAREATEAEVVIRRGLVADFPRIPAYRHALATTLGNLGVMLSELEIDGADDAFRDAVRELDGLVAEFPATVDYRSSMATFASNLALGLYLDGDRARLAEAGGQAQKAIAALEALGRADPGNPHHRRRRVTSTALWCSIERASGRGAAARPMVEKALALAEEVVAATPHLPDVHHDLADASIAAAMLARDAHDHARARAIIDRALAAARTARQGMPDNPVFRQTHAFLQRLHALALARDGDWAGARAAVPELVELFADEDGRGSLAAGDVLRAAWQAAGRTGRDAAECARLATAHYDAAIARLDGELAEDPSARHSPVLRARALVGRAILAAPDSAEPTTLADALAVLRREVDHGHFDPDVRECLAEGSAALAARQGAAGDLDAAERTWAALGAALAGDAEHLFLTARLQAGRAAAIADPARARAATDRAAATLRLAVEAGFRDADRVRAAPELAVVRARPEVEALLR